jgi:hypothetical protein
MADFDVKQEAHSIVAMMVQARWSSDEDNDLSHKYLDDAKQEFCKNTPEQRQAILDLWTRAPKYKDGENHDIGISFKGLYINLACNDK